MRMKYIVAYLAIIILSVTNELTFAQSVGGMEMTLSDCLKYAIENNENIKISDLETKIAHATTGEYLSTGFPQVDASVAINKNFKVRRTFVPANIFDPTASENDLLELSFGTPYDGDIGLSVSQMIFNGSYFVGVRAAKTFEEVSKKELVRTKIDVIEGVTKAYFTVLANKVALDLVKSNYNRLDTLLSETKAMYESGFAEKMDYNRTQVEFNNIKTQLSNTERLVEISIQLLKFQMGMPISDEMDIAEKLSDIDFRIAELLETESDYVNRIEYSTLQTRIELAYLEKKNNSVQYLPNIDLFLGWGMNAGVRYPSDLLKLGEGTIWPDYQLAGLAMYIPIFDGLRKSKLIQQNRLKIEQLGYQRSILQNSINLEVSQARNSLESNIDKLKSQTENMELAKEVYEHSRIKYQQGVGSNLEVIEADNAYITAQTNYFNALYDALISKVELEKALGILDENNNIN
jgi:outer membrane protein TolC